jgi:hypothetical protein
MPRSLLAVFLLACSAASAQKVNIDYDKQADFSHIRRYQWRTHPMYEKNPELREQYSVAIQLVQQSGNKALPKRGYQPTNSTPDVFITFFVTANLGEQTTTTFDSVPWYGPGYGYGYGWYAAPVWTTTTTEQFIDGNLVIDIVDAKTSKLLWRAYCSDKITDMSNRDKNIDDVVRKAFGKFPPKKK